MGIVPSRINPSYLKRRSRTITFANIATQVAGLLTAIVTMLEGLLLPATGTTLSPLQALMWAGLVLPFLVFITGYIRKLARAGGGG